MGNHWKQWKPTVAALGAQRLLFQIELYHAGFSSNVLLLDLRPNVLRRHRRGIVRFEGETYVFDPLEAH